MKASDYFWLRAGSILYPEMLTKAKEMHKIILKPLLESKPSKTYLITGTAQKIIDRIKMDKIDFTILKHIPEGRFDSVMARSTGNKHIYQFDGVWIYGTLLMRTRQPDGADYIQYHTYRVNTDTGKVSESADYPREFLMEILKEFVFMYLSDIVVEFLEPGRSNNKPRSQGKVLNNSDIQVTVVDSKWNSIVIRDEAFLVRGHFRLQPHGPKLERVKLIYIEEFEKKGYHRGVKH